MSTTLMLIDATHPEETRVVTSYNDVVEEYDFVTSTKKQNKGNIYLAKVTRVEPSLQAAFVDYGSERQGFLPFSEIHPDYYQIPSADKKELMAEVRQASRKEDKKRSRKEEKDADADAPTAEDSISGDAAEARAEGDDPVSADADIPAAEGDSLPAAETKDEVETLDEDDPSTRNPKHYNFLKRYNINEVIKKGQVMLVQVIKEERGNKGAALSTYLSLAGRYCVLMPNSTFSSGGVSRKVTSQEDRSRLKKIVSSLEMPEEMSLIVRTAGADRGRTDIKRDFDYLMRLWNDIRELTLASTAPAVVYEESDIIKRAIRDLYHNDIDQILVEGEEGYKAAKDFMKMLMPSHAARIKQYKGDVPLFYAYDIEHQLMSMHDPIVPLRSGGYLVINQTEALVSIDVNSGRATRERSVEETALKTNIEAAKELSRQLRLRDLAGLLVIDFIDMYEFRNRRAVERALKDALRSDRAKIQLGRISTFGLLEMSRQRLRPSVTESNTRTCPTCQGRGIVRSTASLALQLLRALEKEAYDCDGSYIEVTARPETALYILNNKREALMALESKYNIRIAVLGDLAMGAQSFHIARQEGDRRELSVVNELGEFIGKKPLSRFDDEAETPSAADSSRGGKRKRGKRRGGRDRDDRRGSYRREREEGIEKGEEEEFVAEDAPDEADDTFRSEDRPEGDRRERDGEGRRRRSRGRRGGRRRWERDGDDARRSEGDDAPRREFSDEGAPQDNAPHAENEPASYAPQADAAPAETAQAESSDETPRRRGRRSLRGPRGSRRDAPHHDAPRQDATSGEDAAPRQDAPRAKEAPQAPAALQPAAVNAAPPPRPENVITTPTGPKKSGWWSKG